ncbi:zinc finger BED domain-containing protein 5 [Trichonephila clavipes]|nr:zinc finger BED domain-containing protein 5 [Trichonephila clavipes]
MKPNKLKRHFETLHGEYINKPREFFESKLKSYGKQKNIFKKTLSVNEKALLTSYKVSYKIARCKKPHTIAEELILPAAIEIVETMFGGNFAKELQSIPLSKDTVSRRIDDIAEDVEQQLFRYEWVRDPFQNTPEGFSTTEEESFIDFTSSGEIKRQFCNKTLFQFWTEVDDEFSELKTKAFRILLPFSTSYLCETGFSAVAALKTKYRSQLNIEKELRVSISNIKPSFENLCSARQAHGSH